GVAWDRRRYDPTDFDSSDPINRALPTGSAALYGIAHAVIVGLGCVPASGVIHAGTDRSSAYGVACRDEADVSVPAAFNAVASGTADVGPMVRRLVRDAVVEKRLMPRMVRDLKFVMSVPDDEPLSDIELMLWSELELTSAGINWGREGVEQ